MFDVVFIGSIIGRDMMFYLLCLELILKQFVYSFGCIILLFQSLCNVKKICLSFHFLVLI